jgi:hypothetical protein
MPTGPPSASPQWPTRSCSMAYDEHWQGGEPGPIASNGWFAGHLTDQLKGLCDGQGDRRARQLWLRLVRGTCRCADRRRSLAVRA